MLIVETILKIRRLAHVQGKSIKAICRELGISRKVVRKVLRTDETEFKYERTRQPQPKLGPWRDQLDGMLLANEAKSSRERLTLIRIFEDLRDLGYEGGYDTVRRYARTWAKERGSVTAEAYVPLYYAPGEAYQFDWSHEIVVLNGVTTTVKVALAPASAVWGVGAVAMAGATAAAVVKVNTVFAAGFSVLVAVSVIWAAMIVTVTVSLSVKLTGGVSV